MGGVSGNGSGSCPPGKELLKSVSILNLSTPLLASIITKYLSDCLSYNKFNILNELSIKKLAEVNKSLFTIEKSFVILITEI